MALEEVVPDYFWYVPASSSGKTHPEDHRGCHGLVLHTKRSFTAFEEFARARKEQGKIADWEWNCGRAAILLHDSFKYGGLRPAVQQAVIDRLQDDGELPRGVYTVSNHDVLAAEVVAEVLDVPQEVVGCIASHNGPWYEGPAPRTELEQLHFDADYAASRESALYGVYKPCDELYCVSDDIFPTEL